MNNQSEITISGRKIGCGHPPFIIAEMSGNHNQSLERAIKIVESAAKTGAQALKLQTYTADTLTLDVGEGEFLIEDKDSLWEGKSLYEQYSLRKIQSYAENYFFCKITLQSKELILFKKMRLKKLSVRISIKLPDNPQN